VLSTSCPLPGKHPPSIDPLTAIPPPPLHATCHTQGDAKEEEEDAEFSGALSAEDLASLSAACGEVFQAVAQVLRLPTESAPTLPLALELLELTAAALTTASLAAGSNSNGEGEQSMLPLAASPSKATPSGSAEAAAASAAAAAAAAAEGSAGGAALHLLRQALLGGAETPRLALVKGWARHCHEDSAAAAAAISGSGGGGGGEWNEGEEGGPAAVMRGLVLLDLSSTTGREEILQLARSS
jgi:hypothetical protein